VIKLPIIYANKNANKVKENNGINMWQVGAGGEKKEAFYRSFLENFGGGYLISPIFYENYL
jgi:hypothetical protein